MFLEISDAGVDLIKQYEGFESNAYPDPATGGKPYTIGYGTTKVNGVAVRLGESCTEEQAFQWLKDDVNAYLEEIESFINPAIQLAQSQVDAIASFIYNVGTPNFIKSTLLRKINAQDWVGASKEFMRWNRANGKVMRGLTNRRQAESDMFMSEINGEL